MPINSFTNKKYLEIKFVLGSGSFTDAKGAPLGNSVTWGAGFRASVDVKNVGGFSSAELNARVYGVSEPQMNQAVTMEWYNSAIVNNTIFVTAIDGNARTLVFAGTVVNCWPRYDEAPNVYLDIVARQNYNVAMNNSSVLHFPGAQPVANIVTQLAHVMGLNFVNSENVTTTVTDETLIGSPYAQLLTLMKNTGVGIFISPKSLALTASPRTPFTTEVVPVISKETGLIGYPVPEMFGVSFSCLFNPQIVLGGKVQLKSRVKIASGQWFVSSIRYLLNSIDPSPQWKCDVKGSTIATGRD